MGITLVADIGLMFDGNSICFGQLTLRNQGPPTRVLVAVLLVVVVLFMSQSAIGQRSHRQPTLPETLQWLSGASDNESGDGQERIVLENSATRPCSVAITETRVGAKSFWIKESFSLSDIDPADLVVRPFNQDRYSVRFHTMNYRKTIIHTSSQYAEAISTSDYMFFTNPWFAPRFARSFKRAAELCGAKPSSF
jgi:hypothetical protein